MSRALSAELFKLRTTRTSWAITLGSLAFVVIISTLAALAGDFEQTASLGTDMLSIAGLVQIFALVLGILCVTTEFRHGTITPSLLAVPDRTRLVLAKLAASLLAGLLLGLAASVVCAAIALPVLSSRGFDTGLDAGAVIELIVGNAVATSLLAGIGVALGAVVRNQVGAIVGALVWLFVIEPLLAIIPGFEDVTTKWFPNGASEQLAGATTFEGSLGQLPAGLLLAAYVALFVAAGIAVMRRRDVSA